MLNSEPTEWLSIGINNLKVGHKLNKSEILFKKIEDDVIQVQLDKLPSSEIIKEKIHEISFEDFSKIKLKIAKIVSAESIKKSNKLLKLKVELKNESRQIIAGIAQSYSPVELINKKVVIVSNLKPAKLFGELSEGMILAVENNTGKLNVLEVDENIAIGTDVR